MMKTGIKAGWTWDWRTFMALAAAATIVLRLLGAANPPFVAVYAYLLALPYAAFAYPVAIEARARRVPGFALLAAGLVLVLLSSPFHGYTGEQTAGLMVYLLMLLAAACVFYPMAFVMPAARGRRALTALSGLFIVLLAVLSLLGVVLALTGNALPSLGGAEYEGISYATGRLYAFLYPSAFAVAAGLALLLVPFVYGEVKGKCARALLVCAAVLLYIAQALTGATVVLLVFAACAGGFVFLRTSVRLAGRKALRRILLALLFAAAAAGVCFAGQLAIQRGVDLAAPAPAPAGTASTLPSAVTAETQAAQRGEIRLAMPRSERYAGEAAEPVSLGFAQLRITLWKAALRCFTEEPALLLTGITPMQMEERLAPYLPMGVSGANMRLLPMQALVAYGVPGLLVTLAFAVYVLIHAVRLFFCGQGASAAERSIALVPVFCLLLDCTDCYLTLTDVTGLSSLWFFLAAGYTVLFSRTYAKR